MTFADRLAQRLPHESPDEYWARMTNRDNNCPPLSGVYTPQEEFWAPLDPDEDAQPPLPPRLPSRRAVVLVMEPRGVRFEVIPEVQRAGDMSGDEEWVHTVGVPTDGTPIKDVITRADEELFACSEFGDHFRPETVSALLNAVKILRDVLIDGSVEQYKRENNLL